MGTCRGWGRAWPQYQEQDLWVHMAGGGYRETGGDVAGKGKERWRAVSSGPGDHSVSPRPTAVTKRAKPGAEDMEQEG